MKMQKRSYLYTLRDVAWIYELVMAIPLVSFWFAWSTGGLTIIVGLFIHVVLAFLASKEDASFPWQIGVIANILSFVPLIGWIAHVLAAIAYNMNRNGNSVGYKGFIRPRGNKDPLSGSHTTKSTGSTKSRVVRDAEIIE
jgi:hypothetical protein